MMTDLQGNRVPIPQGATISPIPTPSQSDGMMTDLKGNRVPIPQGATAKPLDQSPPTDAKSDDSFGAAGRFVSGAVNEVGDAIGGAVNAAKNVVSGAISEPEDAQETAIHAAGGQAGLAAYRAASSVVQSAQNLIKAKKDSFEQAAADFVHTAQDLHSGSWRQALSDAGSTAGDLTALNPASAPGTGERMREVSEGIRPEGDLATPLGKTAADFGMAFLGEKSPEVSKVPGRAIETAQDLKPEWITKRPEGPQPMHGTPVTVETPLDSAAISKSLGGKDLSTQAIKTLHEHVGDQIPVGSTPKTQAMAAVEPVQNVISQAASKMNQVVRNAGDFTTNIETDAGFGNNSLTSDLDAIKKNLPASDRAKLSQDVDSVLEDAGDVLKSTNPAEVLEYRRQLGNSIDWENFSTNPETPKEAQNTTRAKLYRVLTDKIHSEIPETVELDKTLQPNLELRSHLSNRLGSRAFEDPLSATAEAQEQARRGRQAVEDDAHNAQVAKNWGRVKAGLITLGVGSGVIHEIERLLP
jgi:hypothetical protein